jgi:hypothetical protein
MSFMSALGLVDLFHLRPELACFAAHKMGRHRIRIVLVDREREGIPLF